MSTRALPFRVLVITDEGACSAQRRGVIETVAHAVLPEAHDVAVLVRMKARGIDDVRAACGALHAITKRAGALLLVHTHVALVDELGLDGAHVDATADVRAARAAMMREHALLGASRHAGDALAEDALAPLDYVTLSPIFAPSSKRGDTRALLGARALATPSARPLVALGGVDVTRAASCLRAGASAVAVIGSVMSAHDPRRALQSLRDALRLSSHRPP